MKPVIGITSYIKKDVFRNYSQVGYEYIDKIEKANGIPMIIPVLQKYDEKELNKIIDFIDGITMVWRKTFEGRTKRRSSS